MKRLKNSLILLKLFILKMKLLLKKSNYNHLQIKIVIRIMQLHLKDVRNSAFFREVKN